MRTVYNRAYRGADASILALMSQLRKSLGFKVAEAEGLEPPSGFPRRISSAAQPTSDHHFSTPKHHSVNDFGPPGQYVPRGLTTSRHGMPAYNQAYNAMGAA